MEAILDLLLEECPDLKIGDLVYLGKLDSFEYETGPPPDYEYTYEAGSLLDDSWMALNDLVWKDLEDDAEIVGFSWESVPLVVGWTVKTGDGEYAFIFDKPGGNSGTFSNPGTKGVSHVTFFGLKGTPIPEPSVFLFGVTGLCMMLLFARRRR